MLLLLLFQMKYSVCRVLLLMVGFVAIRTDLPASRGRLVGRSRMNFLFVSSSACDSNSSALASGKSKAAPCRQTGTLVQ